MTNKEINEYLAETLFGYQTATHDAITGKPLLVSEEWYLDGYYYIRCPDFIQNWQQVVEKLLTEVDFLITHGVKGDVQCKLLKGDKVIEQCIWSDMNVGEAVCRVAVEYLKRSKGNE